MIVAKPGLIANTLLIWPLTSFQSLWLFSMSMLWLPWNCWSSSWASEELARPFTSRLLINPSKASYMTRPMHGMWFLNAGHSIPEAPRVDCSSQVIEWFEEALSVVIHSKRWSICYRQSLTSVTHMASLAAVCRPLTYHPEVAFKKVKAEAINLIESELYFSQCPMLIPIVTNDWCYDYFGHQWPQVKS